MINAYTHLQKLFDIAVSAMREFSPGAIFIVEDLFEANEWNRILKVNRRKLESLILAYAESDIGSEEMEPMGKTLQGQQKYKKL